MNERKKAEDRRKERLAKALKANMAKRKAQAKAKGATAQSAPEKPAKE